MPPVITADGFCWDDDKAERNLREHGVSFQVAALVFQDPWGVDIPDERQDYGEARCNRVGLVDGLPVLVTVCHTERGDLIRIISARPATHRERRIYHEGT